MSVEATAATATRKIERWDQGPHVRWTWVCACGARGRRVKSIARAEELWLVHNTRLSQAPTHA